MDKNAQLNKINGLIKEAHTGRYKKTQWAKWNNFKEKTQGKINNIYSKVLIHSQIQLHTCTLFQQILSHNIPCWFLASLFSFLCHPLTSLFVQIRCSKIDHEDIGKILLVTHCLKYVSSWLNGSGGSVASIVGNGM